MKKILVTGGAGFIGSHLISYLLKQNNHVTCIDSLYSGSKSNILNYSTRYYFFENDFQLKTDLYSLMKRIRIVNELYFLILTNKYSFKTN